MADLAEARDRLRASSEALLDPYVLLKRCGPHRPGDRLCLSGDQPGDEARGCRVSILGHGLLEHWPGIIEAGLFDAYVRCFRAAASPSS